MDKFSFSEGSMSKNLVVSKTPFTDLISRLEKDLNACLIYEYWCY